MTNIDNLPDVINLFQALRAVDKEAYDKMIRVTGNALQSELHHSTREEEA